MAVNQDKAPRGPKKVWTTLITNTAYLAGLLTLDYSLKAVQSRYPLIALYTDTFPDAGREALRRRRIPARRIEYMMPTKSKDYSNDPRFYDCWTKLTPFGLTEYERVVQLDSDMLVLRNMDELMDLDLDSPQLKGTGNRIFAAGHACVCNPLKRAHYPKDWRPENCAFTSQHADPERAQHVGADPAVGPLQYMNGGLQVVNPCQEVYQAIVDYMKSDKPMDLDFADQSLLTDLYRGRWVPLPYVYNALKTMRAKGVHDPIWRDDEVKNIHYILSPKPWDDELDSQGRSLSKDPTHQHWVDANGARLKMEASIGLERDGF